jgi:hypothetical protein
MTPEYLTKAREAIMRERTCAAEPGCTCLACCAFELLAEVERDRAWEEEINKGRLYQAPSVIDTIGGHLASAAFEYGNADAFFNCPCCEMSGWRAYGRACGHAFRAAELAYDAGAARLNANSADGDV